MLGVSLSLASQTPLSSADLRRFSAQLGEPKFNTLWELLAILVALGIWVPRLSSHSCIQIRSDSHGSLSSLRKLGSGCPHMSLILAEIALDDAVANASLELHHIPGVSNILADCLSRLFASNSKTLPHELSHVQTIPCQKCDHKFWVTARPPRDR